MEHEGLFVVPLMCFGALCVGAGHAFFSRWPAVEGVSRAEFALLLGATLALPWLRFLSGLTR